jgi:threonine dehydrogenase-like Zn-dependent dehydrogenase
VTDIDEDRLERAERCLTPSEALKNGVKLIFLNTKDQDSTGVLRQLTDVKGFDDLFVYAPVKELVEQADSLLAKDGCLNFFAGPTNPSFSAELNFYNVHYSSTHLVGTSGGNTDDMREAIRMTEEGKLTPAILVTHIGGLDASKEATLHLPSITGGKKLIYTHIDMPLTAIDEFTELGKDQLVYAALAEICGRHGGLWSFEAEEYLLLHAKELSKEPTHA